jgi:hypothetical protein
MAVGWEVILPISLGYLILVAGFIRLANGEPMTQELPYLENIKL